MSDINGNIFLLVLTNFSPSPTYFPLSLHSLYIYCCSFSEHFRPQSTEGATTYYILIFKAISTIARAIFELPSRSVEPFTTNNLPSCQNQCHAPDTSGRTHYSESRSNYCVGVWYSKWRNGLDSAAAEIASK